MLEIWKDIFGFEGLYQVSNLGHVRSLTRTVEQMNRGGMCKTTYPSKMLRPTTTPNGYKQVRLSKNNKQIHKNVHRLVAETFIPNPNSLPQVNHIDSNKSNNMVSNLEWVNNSGNQKHAFKFGFQSALKGEDAPWSKLTEKQVLEIREKYKSGTYTYQRLADEYHLSHQYVGNIINKRNWSHI